MSRAATALIGIWLGLCVAYSSACIAMASDPAHHGVVLHTGHDEADIRKDKVPTSEPRKGMKEPARQVPVEPVLAPMKEDAGMEPEKTSGEEGAKNASDKPAGKKEAPPVKKADEPSIPSSAAKTGTEKPVEEVKQPVKGKASETKQDMRMPGLPVRKPRKPVYPRKKDTKKGKKKPAIPRSARDKVLCKALQKCRNAFIKCKSKIKHPDQSEPWIIAKEVCGGHYKTCVEKDFQSGEWFMTRWFYFQELNCGG